MGTELKFMAWASEWMATQQDSLKHWFLWWLSHILDHTEKHIRKKFNINTALIF